MLGAISRLASAIPDISSHRDLGPRQQMTCGQTRAWGLGTMGMWWAGRVRRVWAGLVVATRTRRAATCPQRLHVPHRQHTQVLGPPESQILPPQRHPRLCGCAAPPPGPAGAGWHALASSASTPRPAHTAALARVCTPPQLWLASASPGPVPVCAAPSPPPTPGRGVRTRATFLSPRSPLKDRVGCGGGAVGACAVGDDPGGTGRRGTRPAAPSQCWPPRPGRRLLARRRGGMGARSQVVACARVVWAARAPPPLQPPPQLPP